MVRVELCRRTLSRSAVSTYVPPKQTYLSFFEVGFSEVSKPASAAALPRDAEADGHPPAAGGSPRPGAAPRGRQLGNERYIDHVLLAPCAVLQPSLANWRLLHTTLTRIAVECESASRALSMVIAEIDFGK